MLYCQRVTSDLNVSFTKDIIAGFVRCEEHERTSKKEPMNAKCWCYAVSSIGIATIYANTQLRLLCVGVRKWFLLHLDASNRPFFEEFAVAND